MRTASSGDLGHGGCFPGVLETRRTVFMQTAAAVAGADIREFNDRKEHHWGKHGTVRIDPADKRRKSALARSAPTASCSFVVE
jgi:hypothetical protein